MFGYSSDRNNDLQEIKSKMKFEFNNNIENEEVIDYSFNCYLLNEKTQQNESIINYQINYCNEENNKNKIETDENNDDEIIQFSNFNDTINAVVSKECINMIEKIQDEIIEYNSGININNEHNNFSEIVCNEEINEESDECSESDNSYGNENDIINADSVNPDMMTYEQLLELQEKVGFVNRGFSESMIKVNFKF